MPIQTSFCPSLIAIAWITFPIILGGCESGGEEAAEIKPQTEVVAVDRTWHAASLIENDNTGNLLSIHPQTVIDSAGNAIAVWTQALPNTPRILSNRFSSSSGWTDAVAINNQAYASSPEITIAPDGNAIAIWAQFDGIWSNRFTAGIGWGDAELVGPPNTPGSLVPRIAINKDGTAIAVWQQGDGSRVNIWSNRYTPSIGWGVAELIELNNNGDAEDPRIAVDSSGDALAVWRQVDATGRSGIWSNHYKKQVGWGTAGLVETMNSLPDVAMDGLGNALAVWTQGGGNTVSNIRANQYRSGQGWGVPFLLETDDTGSAYSPKVAFDSEGNALVLWTQTGTVTRTGPCLVVASVGGGSSCNPTTVNITNLWSRRYLVRGDWGNRELVETNDQGNATAADFSFDGMGNALAVWTQPNGRYVNVWANRYKKDIGWGTATSIQSNNTGDAMSPAIAVNVDGKAIAVWGQSDGVRVNVWANRFQ